MRRRTDKCLFRHGYQEPLQLREQGEQGDYGKQETIALKKHGDSFFLISITDFLTFSSTVRPGTVWRMYARETYDVHMDAFEPGEILRIPLDSVILMLKEMLPGESVVEVLLHCLEPPNIKTIDRSFESLYRSHFVSSPDDSCDITTLGAFVSALGLDLALGSLIGLGLQFGVGKEAIMLAAVLSFPKSPWIISSKLNPHLTIS